jgi:hypothetical protein
MSVISNPLIELPFQSAQIEKIYTRKIQLLRVFIVVKRICYEYEKRRILSMWKTKRTAMTLALGLLFVLFSTAFAAAPAQASGSRTASAPPPFSQQLQPGWSGWFEVPPSNGFTSSGPALTFDQANDYVFVRGTNNHIYVNASSSTGWSGWREVPGQMLTPSAPAATTNGTTVSLFVRGTDNKIYRNTLNGTSWSGWSQVPGNKLTIDTPSAYDNGVNSFLALSVRGTDNRIYRNTLNGTTWSGWSEVPGHGLTLSGPTTAISTSSKGTFLNLFVRGTNNHLYVNSTLDGTTWSGWSEVPGHGLTPSAPAASTLYLTAGNTLNLFVRGTNNKLYVNTFANGTTWSGWSQVPGNGLTPDAPGTVAFATNATGTQGQVALSVRGTNNRIYLNVLQVG